MIECGMVVIIEKPYPYENWIGLYCVIKLQGKAHDLNSVTLPRGKAHDLNSQSACPNVRNFKSVGHEIFSGERLALKLEWSLVDAVQLTHAVTLGRIKTSHLHSWQMLVDEGLCLPPVEDGLVFS